MIRLDMGAIRLKDVAPLLDGEVPAHRVVVSENGRTEWALQKGGSLSMAVREEGDVVRLDVSARGLAEAPLSLGLRFGAVTGALRFLRNGYHSWDGSEFVAVAEALAGSPSGTQPITGHAMTALVPADGSPTAVLGFERHDRFQSRLRFRGEETALTIDVETLLDRTGASAMETLLLFTGDTAERALVRWSELVAAASPLSPRLPSKRIRGWCSWYNLYAAITEDNVREHLAAAAAFRDRHGIDLDVFLIDDGFTPEMGDWLDVKPQFPRGMGPLLAEVTEAGFTPGLWIAPFMVGNRSRLFTEHPDWVVRERSTGAPLVQLAFYGEFRWHKRSEEYYVLDITHPDAEAWLRRVLRTWTRVWGAGYLKTDFMYFGAEHGPDRAAWHEPGLSRIAVWRRMAALIREEIGDALWLGCGCPLWASVGLVDAVRIGRDVGVNWAGERSAESLLRDQVTRSHGSGRLWQADPDCVLLRDRFHHLTDAQVESLALLAGLSGGVLMTSDHLGELSPGREDLFAALARLEVTGCSYPSLGNGDAAIVQRAELATGRTLELRLDPKTGESSCSDDAGNAWPS